MQVQVINLPGDGTPYFDQSVDLDVGAFIWTFKWNAQDESWYMDVKDTAGNAIAYSLHVVLGVNIGRRVRHPLFQTGVVFALDLSGANQDAGLLDLGTRVQVFYMTDVEYINSLQTAGLVSL